MAGFRVVADDEQSLMSAVAQQPVSVTVRGAWGDRNAFQNYTGGVLKADCGPGAQHPVTPSGSVSSPPTHPRAATPASFPYGSHFCMRDTRRSSVDRIYLQLRLERAN